MNFKNFRPSVDKVVRLKVRRTLTVMLSTININASSRAIERTRIALTSALTISVTTSVVATTRRATTTAHVTKIVGPGAPARHMMGVQIPIQPIRVPRTDRPTDRERTTRNGHSPTLIWQNSIVDAPTPGSCRNLAAQIVANLTKLISTVNRVLL